MSGLDASITVERDDFRLDIALTVAPGSITAIIGPNGSGKTTTLRALAGLTRLTAGRIVLGDRTLDDEPTGVHVVTAHRNSGVVFQDYLLFPHLSALENVAFGLIARHQPRPLSLRAARDWLARLGIQDVAHRRPAQLSGGQAQRVALARALVLEPPLLLLDEPLAALDAGTRVEVRATLATELGRYGGSTVLVTHDPSDVVDLADEIVVLDRGRVIQRGSARDVVRSPASPWVAALFDT
jgi:molybdate transport system ATP-binding protein